MAKPEFPSLFIMTDRSYMYHMQSPFFLAIDERIVNDKWESRELHWHDYFEIEIILSGSGVHQYNGINHPLSEGSAYLLTPMDIHALVPDPGTEFHLVHLRFDEKAITQEVRDLLLQHKMAHTVRLEGAEFERLLTQLTELLHCFESDNAIQSLSVQLMLSYLCLHIVRESKQTEERFPSYNTTNPVVHQTLQYILYNFRKKITMQELGERAHISPNHLALLFKQATGTTCIQLIADLRLQYTLKLLENPNLSIETISEQAGFSATSYFISVFRKQYGITPKEYQNKMKKQRGNVPTTTQITDSYDITATDNSQHT